MTLYLLLRLRRVSRRWREEIGWLLFGVHQSSQDLDVVGSAHCVRSRKGGVAPVHVQYHDNLVARREVLWGSRCICTWAATRMAVARLLLRNGWLGDWRSYIESVFGRGVSLVGGPWSHLSAGFVVLFALSCIWTLFALLAWWKCLLLKGLLV